MRAGASATGVVAAASVAVAALGHALAGGGLVPGRLLVPLIAFAAACWLAGELLGRRFAVPLLAGIQLAVHHVLGISHRPPVPTEGHAAHTGHHGHEGHIHSMSGSAKELQVPAGSALDQVTPDLFTMTAAHLVVLLAGVLAISRTQRWVQQIVAILARLVPAMPAAPSPVPAPAAAPVLREHRLVPRSRPVSTVLRRGPPVTAGTPPP